MRSLKLTASTLFATTVLVVPAGAASASTSTARFRAGSGNYLTSSGTDNLRQVSGSVKFSQTVPGAPISASGSLSGLQPNTGYVTVPYKDGACVPAAGVTAFPSAPFYTNATGQVTFSGVTVNPAAINPLGSFNVNQTKSVSVRQLVVSSVTIPGVISTPNVPNVGAVEACDRAPVTSS